MIGKSERKAIPKTALTSQPFGTEVMQKASNATKKPKVKKMAKKMQAIKSGKNTKSKQTMLVPAITKSKTVAPNIKTSHQTQMLKDGTMVTTRTTVKEEPNKMYKKSFFKADSGTERARGVEVVKKEQKSGNGYFMQQTQGSSFVNIVHKQPSISLINQTTLNANKGRLSNKQSKSL